jgi:hypothetical protein
MPETEDLCHPETVRVAAVHQAEAEKIATELAAIARTGMVLPGSITVRRTRCGRRNCACHADPPRLHGPYWQWTRKIAAKTMGRWLSADQHRDYQAWIDNDRRLRELLARLEALGAAAFDADPRWERRPRTRPGQPPEPERQLPDHVDDDRLTRGRQSSQAPFAQLRPKREDLSAKRPGQKLTGQLSSYAADGNLRRIGRNLGDRVLPVLPGRQPAQSTREGKPGNAGLDGGDGGRPRRRIGDALSTGVSPGRRADTRSSSCWSA